MSDIVADAQEGISYVPSETDVNTDGPVTITFEQLYYAVQVPVRKLKVWEKIKGFSMHGFPKDEFEDKYLLSNVTGTIKPNTMTALMGPSGAGKSTLLDVLAKRKSSGTIEGTLLANGVEPDVAYKRMVGYVEQTDTLLPTLTPSEIFYYTARLRLPSSVSKAYVEERVKQVIEELGLQTCQDNMIGSIAVRGISGGQAKRVNIGIELITDPRVLFLDEPTTGLDSATSLEVMGVMRDITNRGRTTICTIHQPSSDVFRLFDRLLLLVAGEIVFLGEAKSAVSYFNDLGFTCPEKMNPADFLISVTGSATKDFGDVDAYPGYFAEKYIQSNLQSDRLQSAQHAVKEKQDNLDRKSRALVEDRPQFINSQFWNFYILLGRFFATRKRDVPYWVSRMSRIVFMVILVSTVFLNQGNDQTAVYNIVAVLNFSVMTFAFGSLTVIGTLVDERNFLTRERNASAYQISSYYCANMVAELPIMICQSLVWSIVVYWSVGLRSDAGAFFIFLVFLIVLSDIGFGIAQTFGALGSDFEQCMALLFPVVIFSFLFAGFYVQKPLIPDYWIWAYYTSYIQYGLNGMMINQFPPHGEDEFVACTTNQTTGENVCKPMANEDILVQWGFGDAGAVGTVWENILVLVGIWFFWRIVGYLALRFKRHGSR